VLEGLDPYTTYIPESERESYEAMTTGRYGGIGALIQKRDEYVQITEVYKTFPAHKAGLLIGDIITEINGITVKRKTSEDVSNKLKGSPGTHIEITIMRPDKEEKIKKEITRQEVRLNSVSYYGVLNNQSGYISLDNFTEGAHKDFKEAFEKLKTDHDISSLVVDLRGNPGGLMKEAIMITNFFVKRGSTIVSTKGKVEQWNNTYKAEKKPVDTEIPVVIIVDDRSASASEIIAGAFQDLDRGIVIGQRTFGKGLVQTTRPLSYNAQLKITTARYYTPSGRCIQAYDFTRSGSTGRLENIPDSLISKFTTLNGREVYDGGGIIPDIKVEKETLSRIAATLYLNNLIFDFATQFTSENEPPVSPSDFSVSQEIYTQFTDFLENKEFEYTSESQEKLEKLIEATRKENYYKISQNELKSLQEKLAHDKVKDLEIFREQIKKLIKNEITGRYYFRSGKRESSLQNDANIELALELLEDNYYYNSILCPDKPKD